MKIEQALDILARQDTSDLPLSLEACATVLRRMGIAKGAFMPIAHELEKIAFDIRDAEESRAAQRSIKGEA